MDPNVFHTRKPSLDNKSRLGCVTMAEQENQANVPVCQKVMTKMNK